MSFLQMGEKINFYASHTLVHSLLNADVALSCPIQLYLTGLSDLGVGCVGTALLDLGRSVNPVSIRRADYAHHITTRPPPPPRFSDFPTALRSKYVLYVMKCAKTSFMLVTVNIFFCFFQFFF